MMQYKFVSSFPKSKIRTNQYLAKLDINQYYRTCKGGHHSSVYLVSVFSDYQFPRLYTKLINLLWVGYVWGIVQFPRYIKTK